jgi:hypothetical protein
MLLFYNAGLKTSQQGPPKETEIQPTPHKTMHSYMLIMELAGGDYFT